MDRGRSRGPGRPRRRFDHTTYEYDDDYEDYRRRRPYPPRSRPRPRPRRRVWPVLLTGCGLGILATVLAAAVVVFLAYRASQGGNVSIGPIGAGPRTFTREDTTQVPLASLTQILICDKIGNVSITVNPAATTATVKTKKIVHKTSQADADQEFGRIVVEVQPPGTITNPQTCTRSQALPPSTPGTLTATPSVPPTSSESALIVNVAIPNSDGLLRTTGDSVDVAITLPQKLLTSDVPSMLLAVNAPMGNITIDGLSGLLDIKGNTGNVTITHAVLADGSRIETGQGNVTFNGWLLTAADTNTNTPGRYVLQSEQGTIDITLPATTNVTLDANTNVGAIRSEFPIPVNNNGGPVNYAGPLNPTAGNASPTKLILDVSTGNVNIRKAQT